MDAKIRIGVLSTAKIGRQQVIPALSRCRHAEVSAIASRDLAQARRVADELGIEKAFGSYEALLADPEIDAVYNPLPNHLHVSLSIAALSAGKHVLCEKPIALSSEQGLELLRAAERAPRLKVMEAFMYRLHPQWLKAASLVRSGGIGELKTINSIFSYFNDDPANIRNQADIGGGGLMDIGCYNISLSRLLFQAEPTRAFGLIERDPRFGTDRLASAILDFGRGTSTFSCSTQLTNYQRVNIFGTTGRVEIEIPFNAPADAPTRIFHQRGGSIETIELAPCNQYTLQGDAFARAILDDTAVPTTIADAVANMRVIEAIQKSAATERWQPL